MKIIMIM